MPKRIHDDDRSACSLLIGDIQALESRAHRLGMVICARALNNAKNVAGWELAGRSEAADLASRGARVGE